MKHLRDRVAVVTGAASGIGRALADRFVDEGMRVVLADVEPAALDRAAGELSARGGRVHAFPTDVSVGAQVDALAAETLRVFGAVHVVCNNAGVSIAGPAWAHSEADWQWVLGVNLWGVIHGVRAFVPILLRQGDEGHVVNTASMAGLVSVPGMSIYNVTKHGVVTLSETLAQELALGGSSVGVSVLCPSFVRTRILDSQRNRPTSLGGGVDPPRTEQQAMMHQFATAAIAAGTPPETIAAQVVAAIREQRFYVLPHPEMKERVRVRMTDIVEERNPTLASPTDFPTGGGKS